MSLLDEFRSCFHPKLPQHLVERLIVATCQRSKNVGTLENADPNSLGYALSQNDQFFFVSFKGFGEAVDQGVAGVVAKIQSPVLNSAQVSETDADLLRQITEAPAVRFPHLPNPVAEGHRMVTPS
jgi:hypothetical protein